MVGQSAQSMMYTRRREVTSFVLDKQADATEALRVHGSALPTGGDVLFGQEFQEVLLKEVRPVGGMAQLLRLKQQRSQRDRRDNKG